MFSSNAAKQLESAALQAGKTAVKDVGMKAIDVGKTVPIDAGRKLVEKATKRLSTPKSLEKAAKRLSTLKSKMDNVMVPPEEITKKVKEVVAKYVYTSAINLDKLIDGSRDNSPTASNAIAIQDLVKRLHGSGLKVT